MFKRLIALASLGLVVYAGAQLKTLPDPYQLFRKTLFNSEFLPVTGMYREGPQTDTVTYKVWQNKAGRNRTVIMLPAEQKGSETIFDSQQIAAYDNESKTVTVFNRREQLSLDARMKLIRKNYRLYISEGGEIADRNCFALLAVPNESTLDSRKFLVDRETAYPLQFELGPQGKAELIYRYLEVDFDGEPEVPNASILLKKAKKIRDIRGDELDRENPEEQLGFSPHIPKTYPYGFIPTSFRVLKRGTKPALSIRLTDGLAILTVYETTAPLAKTMPVRVIGNVNIRVQGPIPTEFLEKFSAALEFERSPAPPR